MEAVCMAAWRSKRRTTADAASSERAANGQREGSERAATRPQECNNDELEREAARELSMVAWSQR